MCAYTFLYLGVDINRDDQAVKNTIQFNRCEAGVSTTLVPN